MIIFRCPFCKLCMQLDFSSNREFCPMCGIPLDIQVNINSNDKANKTNALI